MDQDIINKIKKLLALAESSNENEAAIAFARAQKLMQDYDISMNDISESAFSNANIAIPVLFRNKVILGKFIRIISETFGIEIVVKYRGSAPISFVLIGKKERVLTAEYAFTILYRSLYNARNRFYISLKENLYALLLKDHEISKQFSLEQLFSIYKKDRDVKKELKQYLYGYLTILASKVQDFIWEKEEAEGLSNYMKNNFPNVTVSKANRKTYLSREEYAAFLRGQQDAGSEIHLFQGVTGLDQTKIEFKE